MDYHKASHEELVARIEELERLNRQLLKEQRQEIGLDFAWTGNLGHWYWDYRTNTVTFNPLKTAALGYEMSELPERVPYQFFTDRLHPGDFDTTMDAMRDHLYGRSAVYETEYRIKAKDGSWKWFYDRGRITQRDETGKPIFMAGIVFDITRKKQMELELAAKNLILAEQSTTDGLTGLKNHRALMEYLRAQMDKALEAQMPLAIALFDIDNFKRVNDTKGHLYGDRVLMETGVIFRQGIRQDDMAGRYGGEEFLLILPGATAEVGRMVAERKRAAIEVHFRDEEVKVTISGGVSAFMGESIEEFIRSADEKLYAAKRQGKNRIL